MRMCSTGSLFQQRISSRIFVLVPFVLASLSSRPLLPYFEGTGAPALSALMSKVQASLRTFLKVHSDSFHAHLFCSVVLGSRAFLNSEYSCYERRYTHFRNE